MSNEPPRRAPEDPEDEDEETSGTEVSANPQWLEDLVGARRENFNRPAEEVAHLEIRPRRVARATTEVAVTSSPARGQRRAPADLPDEEIDGPVSFAFAMDPPLEHEVTVVH